MEGILPGREEDGFLVDQLMEYHVYNVSIAASTDKGFGNYSLPLTVLTDEHGMQSIIYVCTMYVQVHSYECVYLYFIECVCMVRGSCIYILC